jgi:hypothetical protein
MECIRKSLWKKNNSIYRLSFIPYFLYKIFALYGESIKLPILWAIAIISLIAGLDHFVYNNYDIITALKQSAYNFAPISWTLPQDMLLNKPAIVDLYFLEKSFSLIIFGSLFIALRRRFERKK